MNPLLALAENRFAVAMGIRVRCTDCPTATEADVEGRDAGAAIFAATITDRLLPVA